MKLAPFFSALIAGGLVVGSAFGDPTQRPGPPPPPKAPTISIQIDGLDEMIEERIEDVLKTVSSDGRIPPQVRDKLEKRLERVRTKIKAKTAKGTIDPEQLEELGEEIGKEMEAFGKEMEAWGDQFGKHVGKQMKGTLGSLDIRIGGGDDDDDDDDDADDDDDVAGAMRGIGTLNLRPQQREQIKKLRADSDAKVATARRELDRASDRLTKQLENPATSETEIARSIDAVAQQEAAIRKARILAWVNARRILDDGQRTQVERAAKGKTK